MQNNQEAIREAMRMANSPAGQALLQLLQQQNGPGLQSAINSAAAGDYNAARKALNQLLSDPRAKTLLEQMGGTHGSDGR